MTDHPSDPAVPVIAEGLGPSATVEAIPNAEPGASGGPAEVLDLLNLVEVVLATPGAKLGADRPLPAVLLLRQALEEALDGWWTATMPAMVKTTRRDQLVTLPFYLDDPDLAGEITWAWNRLSAICHHHVYDIPPLASELHRLKTTVRALTAHR